MKPNSTYNIAALGIVGALITFIIILIHHAQ